ncbi:unnamed protein product [Triticum turgidum subsp. durum]|uniref:ZF-HD dimerization-type domain-containing protein n=1 Tax=Triticum turgidum subsp. durum TaxID=4567 RepID=A0A9R1R8V1_TRITD|nr:unnamed protein product [Triticum turgidum subsp. durum]
MAATDGWPSRVIGRWGVFVYGWISGSGYESNKIGARTPWQQDRAGKHGAQKIRMRAFAEKQGWRINRDDGGALERFCLEIGVKRNVLKVWMHNHKHQLASPTSVAAGMGMGMGMGIGINPGALGTGTGTGADAGVGVGGGVGAGTGDGDGDDDDTDDDSPPRAAVSSPSPSPISV